MNLQWMLTAPVCGGVFLLGACSGDRSGPVGPSDVGPAAFSHVAPVLAAGNPTCTLLGYDFGFKPQPEPPPAGTYTFPAPDGVNTVTITSDGTDYRVFSWSSTLSLDAVIVKGGPNANVYIYDDEEVSDDDLASPINPSNDLPYIVAHIEFCYDYEVSVSKTAIPTFTRTYTWDIEKTGDASSITLSPGQVFTVTYNVGIPNSYSDGDWSVDGVISIVNSTPHDATVEDVTDNITGGIAATVDCGVALPITVLAGATKTCTYSASLPDATERVNTVAVSTSGLVGGNTGTASVTFGAPTRQVDRCIEVTDDQKGLLGNICGDAAPVTFLYTTIIGPFSEPEGCGTHIVSNVASFVTNTTGTTGSARWDVTVDVACSGGGGCTLTPGYWKTHSQLGPAPYDDNWANLGADGANTEFFSTGSTYHEVLWTAPRTDPYFLLAHAYIAAKLNFLNGADPTDAQAAFDAATTLFGTTMPGGIAKKDRSVWVSLANALAEYNSGLIGPGQCDENVI